MLREKVVVWLTTACAIILLPALGNPKTIRVFADGTKQIQGWGWQNAASLAGVIVLVALVCGWLARPAVPIAALCATVAVAAFVAVTVEAARTSIDLTLEQIAPQQYGQHGVAYTLYPATGMEGIVGAGVAGAVFGSILLGLWLREGQPEAPRVAQMSGADPALRKAMLHRGPLPRA